MIVLAGPLLLGHPRQLRRRLTPGKLTAAFAGQLADDAAKIIEVAGQTTQGVRHHGGPLADETKQGRQLQAVTSLPDALSVNVRSTAIPSNWRAVLWSRVLARV